MRKYLCFLVCVLLLSSAVMAELYEPVKDGVPVRLQKGEENEVFSYIDTGTIVDIVKIENRSIVNMNKWGQTGDGKWIYMGNLKKHSHDYQARTERIACVSVGDTMHENTVRFSSLCYCGYHSYDDVKANEQHNFSGATCTACGYFSQTIQNTIDEAIRAANEQAERERIASEQAAAAARAASEQAERDRIAREQADAAARAASEQAERDRIAKEQADAAAREAGQQAERDRIAKEQAEAAAREANAQLEAERLQQASTPIILRISSSYVTQGSDAFPSAPIAPEIINGRTMLPFRYLIETIFKGEVSYEPNTREIVAKIGTNRIQMIVGQKDMLINNVRENYDQEPIIVDGHTLVPLRAFSCVVRDIKWDAETQSVFIYP